MKSLIVFSLFLACFDQAIPNNTSSPHILQIMLQKKPIWSGMEQLTLTIYRKLLEANCHVSMLVSQGSRFQQELENRHLPFFTCSLHRNNYEKNMSNFLYNFCKENKVDIIHSHVFKEYKATQAVAKKMPVKIIAHYHGTDQAYLANKDKNPLPNLINTIITSSPRLKNNLYANNPNDENLAKITFLPAFCDEKKFLNYRPCRMSKKEFFKRKFNIIIDDKLPIICMIAHFYACKNHIGLIKAIDKLIHQYKTPVYLMLAGEGAKKEEIAREITTRHLNNHVFLLGAVQETPDLLYYSDVKVLPSLEESFGICILEAALMKKPIILSKEAGTAHLVIKQQKTGLLIDPKSPTDLALKIKYLIENPTIAQRLGINAYHLVKNQFTAKTITQKLITIYRKLYPATNPC